MMHSTSTWMQNKTLRRLLDGLLPVFSLAVVLCVWLIAAKALGREIFLPEPKVAFAQFFKLLGEKSFWSAVSGTVLRSVYAFLLSVLFAFLFSVLAYLWKPFGKLISPIVSILRATPTMSVILMALIWLRSSESPVLIAFLVLFPMEYAGFQAAFGGIDGKLKDLSRNYGVPFGRQVTQFLLPSVLPGVLETSLGAVSLGVKVVISAEVMAQTASSMGNSMQVARIYLDTPLLMGWTISAVIIGFLLEGVFLALRAVMRRKGYEI